MPTPSVPVNGAVMHLQKTPCGRGACPVFSLHIYADGRAVYVGEQYTPRTGTWERRLTPAELNGLRNQFENKGFWKLRDRYDGSVMDVAGVYVSYSNGRRTKQVLCRDQENPPAAFQQLAAALDGVVSSGEWKQPGTAPAGATPAPNVRSDRKPRPVPAAAAPAENTGPTKAPAPAADQPAAPQRLNKRGR